MGHTREVAVARQEVEKQSMDEPADILLDSQSEAGNLLKERDYIQWDLLHPFFK